jgi:peptidoglycan/LPS O-acetylase OafA/YrhL
VATSQGRLGVRIFFMISAFLLYRPYAMAHLHGVSEPALRTYAMRRALRILPAYWVALTVLAIWPGLRGVWTENWWVYYGMLQGYWGSTQFSGLTVAWSLTVEVAFYAALPFLALSLGWLGHGSRAGGRGPPDLRLYHRKAGPDVHPTVQLPPLRDRHGSCGCQCLARGQ